MKKIYLLLLIVSAVHFSSAQVNNYENGDTVNDFTAVDVYGNTQNLYSYTAQGKYVFLDFFYSDCGGCRTFVSVFNEFYDKYGCNEGDVICLAINSGYDKDAAVIEFENTYGGTFHHAPAIGSDGGCIPINDDFDPTFYPACVLIGPDNTMINKYVSPIETVADLEAAFPVDFNPEPMNCSLGTNEFYEDLDFSVYPNPSTGNTINLIRNSNSEAVIMIYNLLGKEIFSDSINVSKKTIYPNLNTGTYFVTLKTNSGVNTHKLIIL